MKVIVMGGPDDGKELDIPRGASLVKVPTPSGESRSLAPTSPFVRNSDGCDAWNVRRKTRTSDGRIYLILVEPRLEKWLTKNFTEQGREEK